MSQGRIRTVCVGGVRSVTAGGRQLTTGIFKTPVDGPIAAKGVNLEGDDQADRTVHGGPHKAVYSFPAEHYQGWRSSFPEIAFDDGAFGENLTTEGLLEEEVCLGDLYRCGTCELRVTQPRMPCLKLAIRLGEKSVVKHMVQTGQTGFYLTIASEGVLQAGDPVERIERPSGAMTVLEMTRILTSSPTSAQDYSAVLKAPHIIPELRAWAEERLIALGGAS